ncbi:MAG TPA: DUF167 domain-containing protein [Longimicrobiales bacterium]|nr:DUF167 domain-containing protein [Longimicrobiales bacterium]
MPIEIVQRGSAVRLRVRVQPRASRTEIAGEHDGALRVRLTSPPVEGAANRQLVELLADTFRIPKSAVRVVSGESGRSKLVELEGVSRDDVARVLGV